VATMTVADRGIRAMLRAILPPKVVRRDAVWAVHMISAGLLLGPWGAWLMLPLHTFGSGLVYRTMGVIAPEAVWGAAFSLVGTSLYVGTVLGHKRVQLWAAALATLSFALIATTLLWGNPYGAGWVIAGVHAVANYWALKRLVN
jgi:hypothetical protein